jgi:hypothetical protein
LLFETLALFKTAEGVLLPAGVLVKKVSSKPIAGIIANFGWENTIADKPCYFLCESEYAPFSNLFIKHKKFLNENKLP